MSIMWDGQGTGAAFSQGLPGPVEAVNAPPSSDADAILALATPLQSTAGGVPTNLQFQRPLDVQLVDVGSPADNGVKPDITGQIIIGVIVAILVGWLTR